MSRGKIVIQLSSTLFEGIKSAARETKLHRNFYATQVIESDLASRRLQTLPGPVQSSQGVQNTTTTPDAAERIRLP